MCYLFSFVWFVLFCFFLGVGIFFFLFLEDFEGFSTSSNFMAESSAMTETSRNSPSKQLTRSSAKLQFSSSTFRALKVVVFVGFVVVYYINY